MISAVASAVLPGLGQLRNGQRRKATVLLVLSLVVATGAAYMVWYRPLTVLTWGVQPTALGWLLIGNGALLGLRIYATVDAWMGAPRSHDQRPLIVAGTTLVGVGVGLLLVVPHIVAGYGIILDKDLLTSVFAAGPDVAATAPPPSTLPVLPTAAPAGDPSSSSTTSAPTLPPATTTTTIPVRLWEGTERFNVLLLGGDAGVGRTGVRTDTIIVASLEPDTGDVGLFGVPRNIARVPLPESWDIWACDCFPGIVNELWDYGTRNPDRFPGARPPGASALIGALEELLAIPIHHFALVNLDGFVDLIDALGGVKITVTERLYDSAYPHEDGTTEVIDLAPGTYDMDGHLALAFARSRQGSDDYNRMGRQRCLLQAVAAQADPLRIARSFADITHTIKENLITDVPLNRLPDLIQIIPKVEPDRIVAVGFEPPTYTGARTAQSYPTPDIAAIRHAVTVITELPAAEAIAALELEPLSASCG